MKLLFGILFATTAPVIATPITLLPHQNDLQVANPRILPRKNRGISAYQDAIDAADPIAVLGD